MEYHYLYQIVSLVPDENGVCKIYSGVRSSEVEPEIDEYFGSGEWITRAVKKHGRDKFIKTIVAKFDTRLEADICETEWLDKLFYTFYGGCWEKFNRHHYNLKLNVRGREGYATSDITRQKQSEKNSGVENPNYGKFGELHPAHGMGHLIAGAKHPQFKGLTIGSNMTTGQTIVFDCNSSIKERGFKDSNISNCVRGSRKSHKNFTFTRSTDENYLRQLLTEDNFFDEQSKTIIQNFLQ